jgi:hypothetical protein
MAIETESWRAATAIIEPSILPDGTRRRLSNRDILTSQNTTAEMDDIK